MSDLSTTKRIDNNGKLATYNFFDGIYDREIRITMINGDPWFVGKDVATALGYANTKKALADHVDAEDKTDGVTIRDPIGRDQKPTFINESGLYSLALTSKLPSARKFRRWVTNTVLPQIRKRGVYMTSSTLAEAVRSPEFVIELLDALREEQKSHIETKSELLQLKKTPQEVAAEIFRGMKIGKDEKPSWPTREIANLYGINAVWLNIYLKDLGVQMKENGAWVLTGPYSGSGIRKMVKIRRGDAVIDWSVWTESGKRFIEELLLHDKRIEKRVEAQSKHLKPADEPVSKKGNHGKERRPIRCIETGLIYESIQQASKTLSIDGCSISKAARGILKSAGGHHWEFIKEGA